MGENTATENQFFPHEVFDVPEDVLPQGSSNRFNDDGHLKRTASQPGALGTASVHIIIAVLTSDIQSLDWTMAQLGWVAGPVVMLLFSFVIYSTTTLLGACYRLGDTITGRRNYMLTDAVRTCWV